MRVGVGEQSRPVWLELVLAFSPQAWPALEAPGQALAQPTPLAALEEAVAG
jgi:hypothetical protein